MPRDGSGNYTLPQAPFQPNTVAQSALVNSNFSDIAAALSDSLSRSTPPPMGADLNMNGHQITNATNVTSAALNVNGAAGTQRSVYYQTNGVARWVTYADAATETGSNAGSNFDIGRCNDTGAYVDTPLSIARSSGDVTVGHNLTVGGALTTVGALTAASLHSTGGANVDTNLTVGGALTTGGGITAPYLHSTGSANVDTNLTVGGTSTLGTVSAGAITGSSLHTTGNATVDSTLTAASMTCNGGLTTAGAASIGGMLRVQGNFLQCEANCYGVRYTTGTGSTSNTFLFGWYSVVPGLAHVVVDNGAAIYALANASDERMKVNVGPSSFDCLAGVQQLQIVEYDWVDGPTSLARRGEKRPRAGGASNRFGLVSQDVHAVLPEAVHAGDTTTDQLGQVWQLNQNNLIALLVGAVQQLTARVEQLEAAAGG